MAESSDELDQAYEMLQDTISQNASLQGEILKRERIAFAAGWHSGILVEARQEENSLMEMHDWDLYMGDKLKDEGWIRKPK